MDKGAEKGERDEEMKLMGLWALYVENFQACNVEDNA
jgi:hypothetical protein